jgi:exopolyphosphatase/guanosine-5'-triphosphate,3'-diphosphate pyrophosphatase
MADTLAALDVGTNSFHLVIARFTGDGHQFEVIEREKEMVRLGSGGADTADMRVLEPEAIERGIAALRRCRLLADAHDAPLYAVATSAVREADNAEEFLRRARDEAGVDVQVIAGTEEARLIHLGVLQAVPVFDKRLVLIDIGGGSTEILVGEQGEVLAATSLKLGAIRLTRRFFRTDILHPAAVDSCRRHVRAMLVPVRHAVGQLGFDVAVGSSGTIGAVAAMVRAARVPAEPAPRSRSGFEMSLDEVRAVVEALVDAGSVEKRRSLPGLDERRADIILAGALILEQVMGELGIGRLTLSDYALREGVLLDGRQRQQDGALHQLRDLRNRNVEHLAELMDDAPAHSAHAADLALQLFDGTRDRHGLGDGARALLEAAARLANVGRFVSHDKHHKHSYYVIRNTDQLTGFTDHEIELIAAIARYHRKSAPKETHVEYRALRDEDRTMVWTCAVILRLAFSLDRSRSGLVRSVRTVTRPADGNGRGPADDSGERLAVLLDAVPGADLSLELYSAADRTDDLAAVLGVPVAVEVAEVADGAGTVGRRPSPEPVSGP